MVNRRQNSSVASTDGLSESQLYFGYLTKLLENIESQNWEDVEFYSRNMKKHVKSLAVDNPDILLFHEAMLGLALGHPKLAQSKTVKDIEEALDCLSKAKKYLIKLQLESQFFKQQNVANLVANMISGIEQTIISTRLITEKQGDENKMLQLRRQLLQVQKDALNRLEPDDPDYQSLQTTILLEEIWPDILKGHQALRKMNLDLAQHYFAKSNQLGKEILESTRGVDAKNLILKSVKDLALGFALLINGYFVYIRILRSSIIGGVGKKDTKDLERIERDFLDAEEMIKNAMSFAPDLYKGKFDLSELKQQSEISKNFRSLCEQSLSLKKVAQNAAPKVVFFFLGTFLVLVFGLPMSGLVVEIGSRDLGFILIVSIFVSVIGTFGFEANRLIPLFDVFAKMLPWGSGSKDENKK